MAEDTLNREYSIKDRDYFSYTADKNGRLARRTVVSNPEDFSDGNPMYGITWDAVNKVVVSTTVDRYDYFEGGLAGTLKVQATITYIDTSKCDVQSAEYNII